MDRLIASGGKERVNLIAEFADAYGPFLMRTQRSTSPKYELEVFRRLITAACSLFGGEQHTIELLQKTRFFSKAAKDMRRFVSCVLHFASCFLWRCYFDGVRG